jgi:hypothetical protein
MADIQSLSHETRFVAPAISADKVWFGLESWKGYLASFPGCLEVRIGGRQLENGDVRFSVRTIWEYHEQVDEWDRSDLTADKFLAFIEPPCYDMTTEIFEDLA